MHPIMIQAMAAERVRETREYAAAAGQASQVRRRQAGRGRAFTAVGRAIRGPVPARSGRPLRGPRAA
jgi:hypothetical protein